MAATGSILVLTFLGVFGLLIVQVVVRRKLNPCSVTYPELPAELRAELRAEIERVQPLQQLMALYQDVRRPIPFRTSALNETPAELVAQRRPRALNVGAEVEQDC